MAEKFIVYLDEKDGRGERTLLHISDGSSNINVSVPVGDGIFEEQIVKFIQELRGALVKIYEYRIQREINGE